MATYRLPKPDGSYMEGVTVKDDIVYGPSGKRLGKTKMFPDLETADGTKVKQPVVAPATNDEGEVKPENVAPGVVDDDEDKGEVRENANGIKQKGMTLGGIKDFNAAYGLEVADASKLFNLNSTKSPDAFKGEDNKISTGDTGYTVPKGSAPIVGSSLVKGGDLKIGTGDSGGYTIPPASVPGTTGHTPEDPQNGVSSQADAADQTRALSMNSGRGSRKDPRNRGNGGDVPFGGVEPSNESLVSPMYKDKARNAYRSGFLDSTSKGPMGVLRDASAAQGVIRTNDGKIAMKDGDGYRTYTGDKSAREVAYDLGGGQKGYDKHAGDFTSIGVPDQPEVQTDDEQTPGTLEGSSDISMTAPIKDMSTAQQKQAAQQFAKGFVTDIAGKLKDK